MTVKVLCQLAFMTGYALNVDGVKPFAVKVAIFVFMRRLDSYVGLIHAANYTGETTTTIKGVFTCSKFGIRRWPLDEAISPRNQRLRDLRYHPRNGRLIYTHGVSHDLQKTATGVKSQSDENFSRSCLSSVYLSP